ncbi:MAG: hypothetical protein ACRC6H_00640 [Culicoidibacterales bacterium]
MRLKFFSIPLFCLSLAALIVAGGTFYNLGIFVDEFNTTPAVVLGGDLWLLLTWAQLGFLALTTILSGCLIFKK